MTDDRMPETKTPDAAASETGMSEGAVPVTKLPASARSADRSARCATVIATEHASRYLQQLCKHFAHKRPAQFDERRGHISFTIGECLLEADAGALRIGLASADEAQMIQLQDVVVRHLVRFAFREELAVAWDR